MFISRTKSTVAFVGHGYNTLGAAQIGSATWTQATSHGYFLLPNVAIGGRWPGQPNTSTVSGASMLADYMSVSTRN